MNASLEGLPSRQIESWVRKRIKEINADFKQFCSDLEEYFDNTKTYEEIQITVANDINLGDPDTDSEKFWGLIESYDNEGTGSGDNYETILGSIKQTCLFVTWLDDDTITDSTAKDLRKFMKEVERAFSWAMSHRAIVRTMPTLKNKNAKKQAARRKGGESRAAIYRGIKAEVARLLRQEQPREGWKSKAEAARLLTDHIARFQQAYPKTFHIKYKNLPERLNRWLYEDEALKAAFEQIKTA